MLEGGCCCGSVRYRLSTAPLIVHACHCKDCQRVTGSGFVINLWIERECVQLGSGRLRCSAPIKAGSGKDHEIFRCQVCDTAIFSHYRASPGDTVLLRAGTLDEPAAARPDVHIFTRSKLPWLTLPADTPSFEAFYELKEVWPAASLQRFRAHVAKHAATRAESSAG